MECELRIECNHTSVTYAYLGGFDKSLDYIEKAIDIHAKVGELCLNNRSDQCGTIRI